MENYNLANKILKIYSPCNQPVVMVKQMQLYGAKNEIDNVEKIYKEISALSDSCNILKYKIYATDEIGKIYKTHHEEQKYFLYNTKLDSLNVLYDREAKLLAMHDKNENYLQDEVENNKTNSLIGIVVFILSTVLLIAIGLFFRKKSSQYKSQKINTEKELIRIKEELKIYSESQFTQKDNENAILNSDKLNKRQKEILKLVAKGLTNKEIGEKLFVTEATVKFHLSNIYSILDVKNRKDILVILSQSNLNPKD
jgi:DNA-binding CsgD family transcriptional regulator